MNLRVYDGLPGWGRLIRNQGAGLSSTLVCASIREVIESAEPGDVSELESTLHLIGGVYVERSAWIHGETILVECRNGAEIFSLADGAVRNSSH